MKAFKIHLYINALLVRVHETGKGMYNLGCHDLNELAVPPQETLQDSSPKEQNEMWVKKFKKN